MILWFRMLLCLFPLLSSTPLVNIDMTIKASKFWWGFTTAPRSWERLLGVDSQGVGHQKAERFQGQPGSSSGDGPWNFGSLGDLNGTNVDAILVTDPVITIFPSQIVISMGHTLFVGKPTSWQYYSLNPELSGISGIWSWSWQTCCANVERFLSRLFFRVALHDILLWLAIKATLW